MRSFVAAAFLLPYAVSAFRNTHSLYAWGPSDATLASFNPKGAKASQEHVLKQAVEEGEACMPALIVSAPGLTQEDIAKTAVIKREYMGAEKQLHLPYFQGPSVDNLKAMIDRRLGGCSTPVVFKKAKDFVQVHRNSRDEWLQELDNLVSSNLDRLPSSRIVLISSVPDLGSHYRVKRQISDEDWRAMEDEYATLNAAADQVEYARPSSVFDQDPSPAAGYQSSSPSGNYTVDPNAGLFFKYSFTSGPLILATLIMLIILIPAVLMSVNAITSIELVKGLENKMQGGQMQEGKKDQ